MGILGQEEHDCKYFKTAGDRVLETCMSDGHYMCNLCIEYTECDNCQFCSSEDTCDREKRERR